MRTAATSMRTLRVLPRENTTAIAQRAGVPVAALVAANRHKSLKRVGNKVVFAKLTENEQLFVPSTLGAPSVGKFKPRATQTCPECPPAKGWTPWDQAAAQDAAPPGMHAQAKEFTSSCGCQVWEAYYTSDPHAYGETSPIPQCPPGTRCYRFNGPRVWHYMCLGAKMEQFANANGWPIIAVSPPKPKSKASVGLGDPCDPIDDDFDPAVCFGGGGGSTPSGGDTGGSSGGGWTPDGWIPGEDSGSATTTEDGGYRGGGQFTPGDPVFNPDTLPPWVKAGMDKCAAKGMDYDAVNDVCSPKGSTYGPKGQPAKGSVPVDPKPTGGGGGGVTKPSGTTKPGGGSTATTSMSAGGKGLGALKWVFIGAGVLAVGGGGYYAYKHSKDKKKAAKA